MSLKSILNCFIEHAICETIIASFITKTVFEEETTESIEIVIDESGRHLIVWIGILAGYCLTLWPDTVLKPSPGDFFGIRR